MTNLAVLVAGGAVVTAPAYLIKSSVWWARRRDRAAAHYEEEHELLLCGCCDVMVPRWFMGDWIGGKFYAAPACRVCLGTATTYPRRYDSRRPFDKERRRLNRQRLAAYAKDQQVDPPPFSFTPEAQKKVDEKAERARGPQCENCLKHEPDWFLKPAVRDGGLVGQIHLQRVCGICRGDGVIRPNNGESESAYKLRSANELNEGLVKVLTGEITE